MKYIDEFRDNEAVAKLIKNIHHRISGYEGEIVLMEVCGTHTMSIFRSGLRKLLPPNIRLLSGPGCPVCVTPNNYLDKAIAYAGLSDTIIATFGDMMRVPGSWSSLQKAKTDGKDIRVIYSALDALQIARQNPLKKVIFLGIGFETTAPTVAATIKIAGEENIGNFYVFSGHKLLPSAMEVLVKSKEVHIDGFICPGHVSTIIGSQPYEFISAQHNIPCVVTGFEPSDIAQAIYMLAGSIVDRETPQVRIQYSRSVKKEGNIKALELMNEVFKIKTSAWRGIGDIPGSGLRIRKEFASFDIEENMDVEVQKSIENKECICGQILRGINTPLDCKLFRKVCKPENPIGACMVSSEGTCAAFFKYADLRR